MPVPDYKKFSRLAGEATLIPIVKSVPADLLTTFQLSWPSPAMSRTPFFWNRSNVASRSAATPS